MLDSCLEWSNEAFEPWIMEFWVRFWKLGLGFFSPEKREEREGEEGRKRKNERNEGIRVRSLLYKVLDRVDSDPIQRPTSSTLRFRSYWIRINPTPLMRSGDPDPPTRAGLGLGTVGFVVSFSLLEFLLYLPLLLLPEPLCVLSFLPKIPKKLPYVSWCISSCFVVFSHFLHG